MAPVRAQYRVYCARVFPLLRYCVYLYKLSLSLGSWSVQFTPGMTPAGHGVFPTRTSTIPIVLPICSNNIADHFAIPCWLHPDMDAQGVNSLALQSNFLYYQLMYIVRNHWTMPNRKTWLVNGRLIITSHGSCRTRNHELKALTRTSAGCFPSRPQPVPHTCLPIRHFSPYPPSCRHAIRSLPQRCVSICSSVPQSTCVKSLTKGRVAIVQK